MTPTLAYAIAGAATTSRKETAAHVSLSSDKIVKQRRSFSPGLAPPGQAQAQTGKPQAQSDILPPTRHLRAPAAAKAKKSANRPTPLLSREVRLSSQPEIPTPNRRSTQHAVGQTHIGNENLAVKLFLKCF